MSDPSKPAAPPGAIQVKVTDDVVGGAYSNHMVVAHTREEFFLDFFTMLPQVGKLASRVIVSPGHLKRILRALSENLARYEARYGPIQEAPEPPSSPPVGTIN
jgi:hypothetical protein